MSESADQRERQAKQRYLALSPGTRTLFVAELMHQLTIVGRFTYETGTTGILHPERLRGINELQHRLSRYLFDLIRETADEDDPWFLGAVLCDTEDHDLDNDLAAAVERSLKLIESWPRLAESSSR